MIPSMVLKNGRVLERALGASTVRSYWFIPTSLAELRYRLQENHKKRVVRVRLLRDKWKAIAQEQYDKAKETMSKREKFRKRAKMAVEDYFTKKVTLTEYSKSEWFDDQGRPRVSRDPTGRFVNPWQAQTTAGVHSLGSILRWRCERFWRSLKQYGWGMFIPSWFTNAPPLPARKTDLDALLVPVPQDHLRLTWIGHATCLVQHQDATILTDPIFSTRASPFQNTPIGIPRELAPSLMPSDLPRLDFVVISHDHYDHLDEWSVAQLDPTLWLVPLGLKDWMLEKKLVESDKIVELEWWESVRLERTSGGWKVAERHTPSDDHHPSWDQPATENSVWVSCCPAQHWAGRALWDRNFRLWGSFAFFLRGASFYHTGDTAMPPEFPLFSQISDYLGPLDVAAIPIGAYEPSFFMRDSHTNPKESVEIHEQLHVQTSIAVHWGTFCLSEEPMDEPPQLLKAAAGELDFRAIPVGATIDIPCESSKKVGSAS